MNRRTTMSLPLLLALGCGPGSEAETPETHASGSRSEKEIVPEARSHDWFNPGGALFQGLPHVAFIGTDRRVNVVRRNANGVWNLPTVIDETSLQGASIMTHGNVLVLAYYNSNNELVIHKSFDGVNFHLQRRTALRSGTEIRAYGSPALVVHGGLVQIYVAIGPTNPSRDEWDARGEIRQYVEFPDGNVVWHYVWPAKTHQPTAATIGDILVVGWTANLDDSWHHTTKRWVPSRGWEDEFTNHIWHQGTFASAEIDGRPALLHVYRHANHHWPEYNQIWAAKSFDGSNFEPIKYLGHTTQRHPAAVFASSPQNRIDFVHVGTDWESKLNFNSVPF